MPSNPANSLAQRVADGFNQHGSFTARVAQAGLAVELRHIDTGALAAEIWVPDAGLTGNWAWQLPGRPTAVRFLDSAAGVDEVVRAVATSVLDERRQP